MRAKIEATRTEATDQLGRVRDSILDGPKTAFETIPDLIGPDNLNPATAAWGLQIALAYLDHLEATGEAESSEEDGKKVWRTAG